jgi:thiol-disulfide isomerase/thioredoxin
MNLFNYWEKSLPLAEFLTKHGRPGTLESWAGNRDGIQLSTAQTDLLGKFVRETNVMVLAAAWCGDCASQCPIFERFAAVAPTLKVRYLERDQYPEARDALKINGGQRIPVCVFFSEDGQEVARFGERTLTQYRNLVEKQTGESCSTGLMIGNDPVQQGIVQDWLNEFERVQWILRLSPRLRQKHGD